MRSKIIGHLGHLLKILTGDFALFIAEFQRSMEMEKIKIFGRMPIMK